MKTTRDPALPLTDLHLNTLNPSARDKILVCMALGDNDLLVISLAEIIEQDVDFRNASPSEALRAFIGDASSNSYEILVHYGPGGWTSGYLVENQNEHP